MKLSPWFPPEVKPIYIGFYDTVAIPWKGRNTAPMVRWWDGVHWRASERGDSMVMSIQRRWWQGMEK